jgi:hypothetical protein
LGLAQPNKAQLEELLEEVKALLEAEKQGTIDEADLEALVFSKQSLLN